MQRIHKGGQKLVAKHITDQDLIDYIIHLTKDDICTKKVRFELFGEFNGKRKCNTYDYIEIPAGIYGPEGKKNKKPFLATVGQFLWNRCVIECTDMFNVIPYVNFELSKKNYKKFESKIIEARLENRMSLEAYKNLLHIQQYFADMTTVICPHETDSFFTLDKKIEKKKQELLVKYKDGIKNNLEVTIPIIEKELLNYAEELMKEDSTYEHFRSGFLSNMGNNFKNMYVMKGLIRDPDPTKSYNLMTSCYSLGIKQSEFTTWSNSMAEGPYKRSRKTAIGGYYEKLLVKALQGFVIDSNVKSDCGTKRGAKVTITKNNINYYMYMYYIKDGKPVEITSENKDSLIGKTVMIRSSMYCKNRESSGKICHYCAGNLFNRIGITHLGESTAQLASKLKNINMKSFHDSQVTFFNMMDFRVSIFDPKQI